MRFLICLSQAERGARLEYPRLGGFNATVARPLQSKAGIEAEPVGSKEVRSPIILENRIKPPL
jgi:hypothetical protein